MKWRGCFLFFLLSFYFITAARGQLITFSVKNERLEKVFLLIEQQSDHHFIYTTEQIEKAKPVTLSVLNEQLSSVLDKCFSGQPLLYNINEKNITVKEKKVVASERSLRGKILDQNGNPVRGVTINIKGTPLVVASDSNGEFGFDNAPLNVTLILTSVEIEPLERYVGDLSFVEMRVSIKVGVLDETIVIAYGKSTRRTGTGTVTSIKKEEIAKQPISNPLSILSGRVAGLQMTQVSGTPGSPYIIRLRGQNSIASGNDPLIILDGIPYPYTSLNSFFGGGIIASPLATLNPSDIESIEVLKDADATAIYGSRGANGVILITSKKAGNNATNVSVRSYLGAGKVAGRMELLNTSHYVRMRKEAFANDGLVPDASNAIDLAVWDTARYTDWQKELLGRTMTVADTKLEFSGGNQQTRFLFSAGYHGESTILPDKSFGEQKLSGSINVQHRTSDQRLQFSMTTAYSRNTTKLPINDLSGYILLAPNAPALYSPEGELNWEKSTWQNPLSELRKTYRSESENLLANMTISFQLLKELEVKAMLGYDMVRVVDHTRTPKSSFDPALPSIASAGFGNGSINTLIAEPQLSYRKSIKQLQLEALAGATFQSSNRRNFSQIGSGYSSDDLLYSLASASTILSGTETDIRYRYMGVFGRLTANWKQRYLVSLNARRDGSSRYGPSNRFANFGSVGLGWIFSKEAALQKMRWLSHGKLKLSAGLTGNDQIGDYNYLDLYNANTFPYQGVIAFQPRQLFNPTFNWERVVKYEAAIDLGLFNDRLLLAANYYHNVSDNQLVQYGLPPSTGFNGILKNLPARIQNTGIELEASAIPVKNKDWNWTTAFNITFPENKLLRFDNLASSTYANTYVVGQSLFITKAYHSEGVDPATGYYRFTDYDQSGTISAPNDQQAIVFTGQQWFGGWQNTISYRQFSLSFLLQFTRQQYASTYLNLFGMPGTFTNQPTLVLDRWTKPGDNEPIQKYSVSGSSASTAFFYYRSSDAAFSDASFIRMKNLYLAYDFKKVVGKKLKPNSCTIFLQAQNLFTISKYQSLDPETRSLMPPVKMITGGFQFSL